MDRKKVLELDKICRVCISERKDMRPLFSEKVADMLMECTSVTIEPTEGWPDKICVQCVHSVSRCHAFKTLVERSDKELREYVKSLTVRVVIEDSQELKLQQLREKQAKLLQLQQQQQALLAQQQAQHRLQQQFECQQQQQSLQKQLQQKQNHKFPEGDKKKINQPPEKPQSFAEQQHHAEQKKPQSSRKAVRQTKKCLLSHHQQHPAPVALHSVVETNAILATPSRPLQQQSHMLPTTAPPLPQQIVLQNGQVITTAQIVAHSGPPQIAHIYNSSTTTTQPHIQQVTPQLLHTTSGQTLQLIQQPNGQHTLQLVQLLPQHRQATIVDMSSINDQQLESRLIEQHSMEHHIVNDDDDDIEDDVDQLDTIVIKEEELNTQPLTLTAVDDDINDDQQQTHCEAQEFEYLEDITVTTTAHQQLDDDRIDANDDDASSQHHQEQHMLGTIGDNDDIIEEINMEEEMMEDVEDDDEGIQHETHVMDADEEDVQFEHLMDEELQYTVIEYSDEIADIAEEVEQEVMQISDDTGLDMNASTTPHISVCSINSSNSKKTTDKSSKKSADRKSAKASTTTRNSSSIVVSNADSELQLDQKFIAEFISQQTTSLGSGRYVCNLCRQEFKQFKGLQNHMHSHSNWIRANCKKQPQCEICFKSFKGPGMLKMHMKTHQSAAKTPVCNICQKMFKSKAILYRHRQTHQLRSYSCGVETCRKTFSTHPNLRMHMTKKHSNVLQPKYKCGECASLFDDVEVLHTHVQMTGHGGGGGRIDCGSISIACPVISEGSEVLTLQRGQQVKIMDHIVNVNDVITQA